MQVTITAVAKNDDGTDFAKLELTYNNLPREKFLVVEEELINLQKNLLEVGKAEQAAKND